MRQIKFRGQLIHSGEWVYGTYHYSADGKMHYILNREMFLERFDQGEWALHEKEVHQVIAKSVSEFTGLKDKNLKEIYEGDILRLSGNYEYPLRKVEFYKCCFWFMAIGIDWKFPINMVNEDHLESMIIIGNIHQNPELCQR